MPDVLSVVVVGELRQGVERLRLRDAPQADRLDRWLLTLMNDDAARVPRTRATPRIYLQDT